MRERSTAPRPRRPALAHQRRPNSGSSVKGALALTMADGARTDADPRQPSMAGCRISLGYRPGEALARSPSCPASGLTAPRRRSSRGLGSARGQKGEHRAADPDCGNRSGGLSKLGIRLQGSTWRARSARPTAAGRTTLRTPSAFHWRVGGQPAACGSNAKTASFSRAGAFLSRRLLMMIVGISEMSRSSDLSV